MNGSNGDSPHSAFEIGLTYRILPTVAIVLLVALAVILALSFLLRRRPAAVLAILAAFDAALAVGMAFALFWAALQPLSAFGYAGAVIVLLLAKQLAEGVLLVRTASLPGPGSVPLGGRRSFWLPLLPPFLATPFYVVTMHMDRWHLEDSDPWILLVNGLMVLAFAGFVIGIVFGILAALRLSAALKAAGAPRAVAGRARLAWLHVGYWALSMPTAVLLALVVFVGILLESESMAVAFAVVLLPLAVLPSGGVLGPASARLRTLRAAGADVAASAAGPAERS